MKHNFADYLRHTGGATAMIYILCLMPLMAGIGLAIDLGRSAGGKTSVQSAIDASVLASTRDLVNATLTDAEIIARAQNYFITDMQHSDASMTCQIPVVTLDRENFSIEVKADCTLPTTLAGLIGIQEFNFSETAAAEATITFLDVSLVLDVSGSMNGQKLEDLKEAATNAVNILIRPETGTRVRMAIVPYHSSVNISPNADDVFAFVDRFERCASERSGALAFSEDAPGSMSYFPSDPSDCPNARVAPLTNNKSSIISHIASLSADTGSTAGHLGAAWGWYVISPEWNGIYRGSNAPHPYDKADLTKAVILMTDGEFNTEYESANGTSFEQAEAICASMKDEGVQVFSVAFQAPTEGETILQACATTASDFYSAENADDLNEAYQAIASQLAGLRLTK